VDRRFGWDDRVLVVRPEDLLEKTYIIVSSAGRFFGFFTCGVDEFDNVCSRSVLWCENWEHAHVFRTRRGAEHALRKIEGREMLVRAAIVE
jgi:hypothetical protein